MPPSSESLTLNEAQTIVTKFLKLLQLRHPILLESRPTKVPNTLDGNRHACTRHMALALQHGVAPEDIQSIYGKVVVMVAGSGKARVKGLNAFFASSLRNATSRRIPRNGVTVGARLPRPGDTENVAGAQEGSEAGFFVAVHIGAGYHSPANAEAYTHAMSEACEAAAAILRNAGGTSLDAVEAAIRALEDSWVTNAGVGSNLTEQGCVECDACIMDGDRRTFGAVGAVPGVKNPISVAAQLAKESRLGLLPLGRIRPVMLVGEGARAWASQHGLKVASSSEKAPEGLVTEKAHDQWVKLSEMVAENVANSSIARENSRAIAIPPCAPIGTCTASTTGPANDERAATGEGEVDPRRCKEEEVGEVGVRKEEMFDEEVRLDTVGAICVDSSGRVAAGVSSGGIAMKVRGRVGEAAALGCGCWAANSEHEGQPAVASSATGVGESIMRGMFARECCDAARMAEDGPGPSCERTLSALVQRMQAEYAETARSQGFSPPCEAGILFVSADSRQVPSGLDGGEAEPVTGKRTLTSETRSEIEGGGEGATELQTVELVAVHSAASFGIGYLASTMRSPKALILRSEGKLEGTTSVDSFGMHIRFRSFQAGE